MEDSMDSKGSLCRKTLAKGREAKGTLARLPTPVLDPVCAFCGKACVPQVATNRMAHGPAASLLVTAAQP